MPLLLPLLQALLPPPPLQAPRQGPQRWLPAQQQWRRLQRLPRSAAPRAWPLPGATQRQRQRSLPQRLQPLPQRLRRAAQAPPLPLPARRGLPLRALLLALPPPPLPLPLPLQRQARQGWRGWQRQLHAALQARCRRCCTWQWAPWG